MSSQNFAIYTGWWTDWSSDGIRGLTLTLEPSSGAILVAFTSSWILFVSQRLWAILVFILHQVRATPGSHEDPHGQIQIIWRNSSSPTDAIWTFLRQIIARRKQFSLGTRKPAAYALLSALFFVATTIVSILSPRLLGYGTGLRLIRSDACGVWSADTSTPEFTRRAIESARIADVTLSATKHARDCYGTSMTGPTCGVFATTSIGWFNDTDRFCPFTNSSMCVDGQTFHMETEAINSHVDLGINTPTTERLLMYRRSTCAPLPTTDFENVIYDDQDQPLVYLYNYGSLPRVSDFTYGYIPESNLTGYGYSVFAYESRARGPQEWEPINDLQVMDADAAIFFIGFNSIYFSQPSDDPIFAAHREETLPMNPNGDQSEFYNPDRVVAVMACVDQYRFCNPNSNACTNFVGRHQLYDDELLDNLDLGGQQRRVANRIAMATGEIGLHNSVQTRQSNALKAQDTTLGSLQLPLPSNQWQIEVGGWFEEGLSKLQLLVHDYVAPRMANQEGGELRLIPNNFLAIDSVGQDALCENQLTRDLQGTISFSGLGLIIIFGIGCIITFLSLMIEQVGRLAQALLAVKDRDYRQTRWKFDDLLQLHSDDKDGEVKVTNAVG